jgi:hypothetical protein
MRRMRLPWFAKSPTAREASSAPIEYIEIIADVFVAQWAEDVRFFSRRIVRPKRLRRFSNRDPRESLLFVFYLGVAALLPAGRWAPICDWVSGLRLKRHMRKDFSRYAAAMHAVLGQGIDAQKLFRALLALRHRRRLQIAAHLVGNQWSPTIRLEGQEGLQAALRRGHGAIIWCDQFASQTIIGKRALHEAGVEAHQVSVSSHGPSDTTFGQRFLNRPMVAVENRFLKSRIVFDRDDAYQVTVRIQKILRDNGIVLMTNNIHAGSTFTEVAMGESGWLHSASAPSNFAARGKAALFAMSTFETAPFREYRAIISPELVPALTKPTAPTGAGMKEPRGGAKNMDLQAHYILLNRDRMLEAVKLYPEQLIHWSSDTRLTEQSAGALSDDGHGS